MNLNINCYDLSGELNKEESIKGTSFIIQLPFKVYRLLKVIGTNFYTAVDIDSLDQSYVQLSFIPAGWDIRDIDPVLNDDPNVYSFLGEYKINHSNEFVFVFARVLTEKEVRILEND